jgi:hypothetical protein
MCFHTFLIVSIKGLLEGTPVCFLSVVVQLLKEVVELALHLNGFLLEILVEKFTIPVDLRGFGRSCSFKCEVAFLGLITHGFNV